MVIKQQQEINFGKMLYYIQYAQTYGFSPVWVLAWFLRIALVKKTSNTECALVCGFAPVWINICFFSTELGTNALSHGGQYCGLSPVCNLKCVSKLDSLLKLFPQITNLNSFPSALMMIVYNHKCLLCNFYLSLFLFIIQMHY